VQECTAEVADHARLNREELKMVEVWSWRKLDA
jgi:hypothetical protein